MKSINVLEKMRPIQVGNPVAWVEDVLEEDKQELIYLLECKGVKHINESFSTFNCPEEGNIYSEADIRRMCARYNMKFLSLDLFENEVDLTVAMKIRYYERRSYYNLRLLAPSEAFNQEHLYDPMLFAYTNEGWKLIHKWGNDLSFKRLITSTLSLFTFYGQRQFIKNAAKTIKNPFEKALMAVLVALVSGGGPILIGALITAPFVLLRNWIMHSGSAWQVVDWSLILSILVLVPIMTYMDRYNNHDKTSF